MSKYVKQIVLGRDAEGKQIRKRIYANSQRELERKIEEVRSEYRKVRRPSAVTFGAYSERWLEVYKSARSVKTKEMYRGVLNKCGSLTAIPIKDVTKTDLQAIINEHREHAKTCRNISLTLKQIFKAGIADGIIVYNPADALDLPKYVPREMRFITDAEMKIIKETDLEPLDRLYVEVLRCTGMRPAEALALQWGDIETDRIRVNRSFEYEHNQAKVKLPKTGKKREIPIPDSLYRTLSDEQQRGIFVFSGADGSPLRRSDYKDLYKRVFSAINEALGGSDKLDVLNGMNFYSFRHTYATQVLYYQGVRNGLITTKKAAQIMGHSEKMFIERYTHIDEDKEAIDELRSLVI